MREIAGDPDFRQMTRQPTSLVVVAHPDDEVLGFGATGHRLVRQGEVVQPVILCGQVDARTRRPSDDELLQDLRAANERLGFNEPVLGSFPNIRMNTVPHIEIVQFIEEQVRRYAPSRLVTHHPADLNSDHGQTAEACLVAARLPQRSGGIPAISSVYFMEVLSATDWAFDYDGNGFRPNTFVEIDDSLDAKIDALRCYRHVMRDYPHPRSHEAIRGQAAQRGAQAGLNYAEAFQLVYQRQFS